MNMMDKAKDKIQQAVGSAKEKLGEVTDNPDLRDSGKADQTKGEVKEAGHDLRDKAAGAVQDAKDKLGRNDRDR
ncbi:CsbD family protein [Amycolatopsis suaedae]|uniref:CsbD family protein n=2 Tax=Amycolatopsis suaedae TaxID=2510978 RepID=A0A4Q7JBG7_9PSEU|nr:CsbD family protein [Amycolatopsis suaedae]RZQ64428.1 CsbD family protein [Amycolatopsis suaedae]